jgi:hypothetical protein
MPTFDHNLTPPVDLGAVWRLIARCAPDHDDHSPHIHALVAIAQLYAARGDVQQMRRCGVQAITFSLLIDRDLFHDDGMFDDGGLSPALVAAQRDAEDLMGLHPYGRVPACPPLLALGQVLVTYGLMAVLDADDYNGLTIYLERHERGDWGDVDEADAAINDDALLHGRLVLSSYRLPNGTRFYAATTSHRAWTVLMLTDEYPHDDLGLRR